MKTSPQEDKDAMRSALRRLAELRKKLPPVEVDAVEIVRQGRRELEERLQVEAGDDPSS